jgi:N6-L-threonylcarbamoyladenine synthase
MNVLGIESTAHTFGVGIVTSDGDILANERDMFQTESGGMIPHEVAEHHRQIWQDVLQRALDKANLKMEDIGLISFSRGPGLVPSLKVGRDVTEELSKKYNIPYVGINHCMAHLTIGDLVAKTKDPVYVYVSGVNSQVIALASGKMRIFGETLDIGMGNALDKFGREAGLGFPAGPKIEELARESNNFIELPYSVKGMDVSFAGIVTKVSQLLKKGEKIEDLCFSLQETLFAMLAEVTERAIAHTGKKEVILIGGVAANKRANQMLTEMCEARGCKFMVNENIDIMPYERTDEIEVTWRTEENK